MRVQELRSQHFDVELSALIRSIRTSHEVADNIDVPVGKFLVLLWVEGELDCVARDLSCMCEGGICEMGLFFPVEELLDRVCMHVVGETRGAGAKSVVAVVTFFGDISHGFDADEGPLVKFVH